MLTLTFLSILAVALASDPPYTPPGSGYGPNINDVEAIIASAEVDLDELRSGIASAATLCSVGEDRLQFIREKDLVALNLKDEQQNALIELFKQQVKEMQHRADAAQATVDGAKSRALDTGAEISVQSSLLANVSATNYYQDNMINQLNYSIAEWKQYVLNEIDGSISFLESNLEDVEYKVREVHEYVEDRRCEYGFFSLRIGYGPAKERVDFKTVFDYPPHVSVTLVGFSAHLDVGYKDGYDPSVLSIDKFIEYGDIDTTGFYANALDNSDGQVDVKVVYCSWMACMGIDGKLDW